MLSTGVLDATSLLRGRCRARASSRLLDQAAVRSFASMAPRGPGGIARGLTRRSCCSAAAARICLCVSVSFIVGLLVQHPTVRVLPARALQDATCQGRA